MGKFLKILHMALAVICILTAVPYYGGSAASQPVTSHGAASPFTSFRDIPGVTNEEIAAIEALQKEYTSFAYGMTLATEAFLKENGEVGGYAALFCEWLTGLFDIRFQPEVYAWNDMLEKLHTGELDFVGNLMATEERLKIYSMTDAIAKRQYKVMRLAERPVPDRASLVRPLRYAFLKGATTADTVASATAPGTFEPIWVNNFTEAYHALENDEADAFIGENVAEASFETYSNVLIEDFFPLTFSSASMATANAALEPIISIVTKALQNGAMPHLNSLYNKGYKAYKKNRFFMRLSEKEKTYLQNHPVVPFASQYASYPLSFFNIHEKKWEGIVFEILRELEELTGLGFELINDQHTTMTELVAMLKSGRAYLIPQLILTPERKDMFLWSNGGVYMQDRYVLLSKWSYPNVGMNDIPHERIGLTKNTAFAEMFRTWFPDAANTKEYAADDEAFRALERGEVDLVMAGQNRLLTMTNYYEFSEYKANFLFNYTYEPFFAFNKEQVMLCSIINKAIPLIDTERIVQQWMSKTYNYQARLMRTQRLWLLGTSALLLCVLVLLFVLFQRKHNEKKKLEDLVQKRTAEQRHTLTKLEAVTSNYKGIIWSIDSNGTITTFKGQYLKTIGVVSSFFEGQKFETVRLKNRHLDVIDHVEKIFREGQQDWTGEINGGVFRSCTTPIHDDMGNIVGVVGSTDDVTEIFKLQQGLETAQSASQAKSAFLAVVSHEIRTPMNVILGLTEIQLQAETLSQSTKEAFGRIHTASSTLLGIINDILDLSRMEAGKMALALAKYKTADLINDIAQLHLAHIGSRPIEFRLQLDENMPSEFFGDELRIKQVLNNLLSNAFKYTEAGEVILSVSAEYGSGEEDPDVTLVCSVSDTGPGMTTEQVDRLFDEYSRFYMETDRTVEGTGLGMSIAWQLTQLMDGKIFVESELGKGSVFTMRLPQKRASSDNLGREMAENLRQFNMDQPNMKAAQIMREPMPYGSVLVVDDLEINLYVANGLMTPYGLSVDTAQSGFEAIGKIRDGKEYDIVFMDHMMPEMDGIKATKVLRELGYARPIVALTANAVVGQREMFLDNGFDDFLSKPIDLRLLDMLLNRLIRDKQPPEVIG